MPNVRWTAKLPTLIAGLILLCATFMAAARGRTLIALVLLAMAVGFGLYSATLKEWCEAKASWGSVEWKTHNFGQCLKLKGWWSF